MMGRAPAGRKKSKCKGTEASTCLELKDSKLECGWSLANKGEGQRETMALEGVAYQCSALQATKWTWASTLNEKGPESCKMTRHDLV